MPRPSTLARAALLTCAAVGFAPSARGDVTCAPPAPAAPVRSVEDLIVHSPAHTAAPPPGLRLRTHVRPQDKHWIGPEVPAFVPLQLGKLNLDLLDREGSLYVALYRERWATCGVIKPEDSNCAAEVRVFDCAGKELFAVPLLPHMSRPRHLEVQDVHYVDGTLYFNEACQSYSRSAGGVCSSLVALDPIAKKVLWRTASLTSNNWFVVKGDYIVTAYGFTSEPGTIRVVRRKDGAIMDAKPLGGTNFEMFVTGSTLSVERYYTVGRADFTMTGFDGPTPKLVRAAAVSGAPSRSRS